MTVLFLLSQPESVHMPVWESVHSQPEKSDPTIMSPRVSVGWVSELQGGTGMEADAVSPGIGK